MHEKRVDREEDLTIERALLKSYSGLDLVGFSRNFLHPLAKKVSFFYKLASTFTKAVRDLYRS